MDVPNTTMFCHPQSHQTSLTITGGNFGGSGARVTLAQSPGPGRWECETVRHAPWDADGVLLCEGVGSGGRGHAVRRGVRCWRAMDWTWWGSGGVSGREGDRMDVMDSSRGASEGKGPQRRLR